MKHFVKWLLVFESVFSVTTASATDFSVLGTDISISGFGTAGFAISDKPYNYERVISDDGTFARDSLFGLQADIKLTDSLSVTAQGKFAPSKSRDSAWDASLVWACLSWRPSNDLLFRFGKQRAPVYMYSESMDVGITYDFARLPTEMYSSSPNTDYIGASFSKNWNLDLGELTLDGYAGRSDAYWRHYQRDNVQVPDSSYQYGVNYFDFTMNAVGTALTLQRDDDKFRISVHALDIKTPPNRIVKATSLVPASFFVPAAIAPAFTGSAYTILPQNLGDNLISLAITFGADIRLPDDFRLIGEYNHRTIVSKMESGLESDGGYLAIFKEIEEWTPYFSFAMLQSDSDLLNRYEMINNYSNVKVNPIINVPAIQNAAKLINSSQRIMADALGVFDQHTFAIGTSYRISPEQKIKLEWSKTFIGVNSALVDAPAGTTINNESIDTFSFSYNVAF
ncbi:MAG: hypothetical protein WBI40_10220 [Methylococcaceae bacterium]